MTFNTTSVCLVWVHAFQMEVMGIDACSCSCWGHWQASASAGLAPGSCVTVTPVVTPVVAPSCDPQPLALPPSPLPAWPCSVCGDEQ